MIGAGRFTDIFGMVPAGDSRVDLVVKAALRGGFAIVLDTPGGKAPLCTLTARQVKAADQAARDDALARGVEQVDRVRHACGIAHALTPSDDPKVIASHMRVVARMVKTHGALNIGIEPRASRMLAVDLDTPAQRDAFFDLWRAAGGEPVSPGLTVASPGTVGADGHPIHHGGGHVWFEVPDDVDLPITVGSFTHPDGWVATWGGHQVLVPPSVRGEGPYRLVGTTWALPRWLHETVAVADLRRTERRTEFDHDDPVETFQAGTAWGSLLEPDGWALTGGVEGCGCPTWTAPGDHASPKSAVAHEPGCSRYDTETGWGPLHVWTDNPPEFLFGHGNTFTMIQYIAYRDHGGNMRAAMRATGTLPPPVEFDSVMVELDDVVTEQVDGPNKGSSDDDLFDTVGPDEGSVDTVQTGSPVEHVSAQPVQSVSERSEPARVPNRLPVLPSAFWEARGSLKHVREAALAEMCSPDAVLMTTLTRIASSVDPGVKVDVGLRPASLNLVVCPTGPSSAGKGLAIGAASALLPPPVGADWPDGVGLGSGEGIAEAFMGTVTVETDQVYRSGDRKGQPKTKDVRAQVHHNALFVLDEGQTLAKMGERAGTTVVQALRSLWSGATLGQSNARAETTRHVPAGSYAAGVVLAFQPDTASAVLTDTDGLAQRALWVSATHPDITADDAPHPGPLPIDLPTVDPMAGDGGERVLRFSPAVRTAYREHRAAVARGDVSEGPLDGHLPLLRAKVGALLALLDGRRDVTDEDWELAGTVVDTSVAVRDALMARQVEAKTEAATAARQAAAAPLVLAALKTAELTEQRERKRIDTMARTLAKRVRDADEPLTHSVARRSIKSTFRHMYDDVRDHAEEQGWIVVADDSSLTVGAYTV